MTISHYRGDIVHATGVLAIGFFADASSAPDLTLNEQAKALIDQEVARHDYAGMFGKCLVIPRPTGLSAEHLVLVGLGDKAEFTLARAREAAATAVVQAKKLREKQLYLSFFLDDSFTPADGVRSQVEGVLLANYRFNRYKTIDTAKQEKKNIASVSLFGPVESSVVEAGIQIGEAVAMAVLNARDIVNEPPIKVKPSSLVAAAQEIASLSDGMSVTIYDQAALQKEQFNALLAVAAGSDESPYMIHLTYKPAKAKHKIVFVGKGVTFDSGGLGIKPWSGMLTMKSDMAGAANVLGIFQALAELEVAGQPLNVEVHGIIPTTENMINGKAMRPGDVITTRSGKTIEILHTDAEGRLILSDGLTLAAEQQPDAIFDYATLTGAAVRAVGLSYAAYMGNDEVLLEKVKQASEVTGEYAWPLPLPDHYHHYIEGDVADLQNISLNNMAPDAIVGGLFLQEFVGDTPWVHFDIAGPSFEESDRHPLTPKGATGFGIRLGLELLKNWTV